MSKKLLSLLLIVSLISTLFMQHNVVLASNSTKGTLLLQEKKDEHVTKEVLKNQDAYCFYEELDGLILSYTLNKKKVEFTVNDGTSVYSGILKLKKSTSDYDAIKEEVLLSYTEYDYVPLESLFKSNNTTDSMTLMSYSGKKATVEDGLRTYYGYPNSYYKYLTSRSLPDGLGTLKLYDSFGISVSENGTYIAAAGVLVSAAAAILGFSPASIIAIVSVVLAVQGVYVFTAESWISKFNASAIYSRDVMYGYQLKFQQNKRRNHKAIVGDVGVTFNTPTVWSIDPYFHYYNDMFDQAELNMGL